MIKLGKNCHDGITLGEISHYFARKNRDQKLKGTWYLDNGYYMDSQLLEEHKRCLLSLKTPYS
jgi:hypothetical protein